MAAYRAVQTVSRLACFLASIVVASAVHTAVHAASFTVSEGQSIGAAIQSASAGDTVNIEGGTYVENLVVDKALTIHAKDGEKVVIRGSAADPVISVTATGPVTLNKLIIQRSSTGVLIGGGTVSLSNLVIVSATSTGTAIDCGNAPTAVDISHVTIHRGDVGITCAALTLTVTNNILSNITGQGLSLSALFTVPASNLFYLTPNPGVAGRTSVDTGLAFVDEDGFDFHLTLPTGVTTQDSPAIDKGSDTDIFDQSPSDLGAYGGPSAHSVPFPPNGAGVTCDPGTTSCNVSWTPNTDYLVTGYRLFFAAPTAPTGSPTTYTGTATGVSSPYDPVTASVCSATVCQVSLTGLSTAGITAPAAPTGVTPTFGDGYIQLTWTEVPGATAYEIQSGTVSGSLSVENPRVEGMLHDVRPLINGTKYFLAVGALAEPTLTAAVASVYGGPDPDKVSPPLVKITSPYGDAVHGTLSVEVSETPEPVAGFPPLRDTGGCFIATAAYGSAMAPQVEVLRNWRERYLRPHLPGRVVIRWYETVSPPIADAIRGSDALRSAMRGVLWPVVGAAWVWIEWPWFPPVVALIGAAALLAVIRKRQGPRRA